MTGGEISMDGNQQLGGVTFHHAGAFWFGVAAVTAGVVGHLPMYLMGKDIGNRLRGMPWGPPMLFGMAAPCPGFGPGFVGFFPPPPPRPDPPSAPGIWW